MTTVCAHGRNGRLAPQVLEGQLQTDHLRLWQVHGIVSDSDAGRTRGIRLDREDVDTRSHVPW
jgi:hypothetical protein